MGIEIIRVVKAMYGNAMSAVNINGTIGDPFPVKVGVHQGSIAFSHGNRSTFKGIQNRASLGVTICRQPCADG